MKRKIAILLTCGLVLLSSCSRKPDGMSNDTYDLGKKALEIIEEYKKAEISAEEAREQLDIVYDRLHSLELDSSESVKNLAIALDITKLKVAVITSEDLNECIEDLEEDLSN